MRNFLYLPTNLYAPMKRYSLFLVLIITNIFILAAQGNKQSYIVYSVSGNVKTANQSVQARQKLSSLQTVTMNKESQLTLLDEGEKLLYSLSCAGTWQIGEYIREMKPSILHLSASYLRYVKDQLFGRTDSSRKGKLGKVSTTGYRGDEENQQFIEAMGIYMHQSGNETLQETFIRPQSRVEATYFVTFELVSHRDGSVLKPDASNLKNPYYVRVKNHSLSTLFVNVLNIDNALNTYLVLRPNERGNFAEYLVPAESTVSFPQQTIEFGEVISEHFILIGVPFPVDFSLLESPIYTTKESSSKMKIGMYRLSFSSNAHRLHPETPYSK